MPPCSLPSLGKSDEDPPDEPSPDEPPPEEPPPEEPPPEEPPPEEPPPEEPPPEEPPPEEPPPDEPPPDEPPPEEPPPDEPPPDEPPPESGRDAEFWVMHPTNRPIVAVIAIPRRMRLSFIFNLPDGHPGQRADPHAGGPSIVGGLPLSLVHPDREETRSGPLG